MNQHERVELLMDEHSREAETHNILIRIQMTLEELLAVARHIETNLNPRSADSAVDDEFAEPDIDDEPPPDYGPPGSGAVITEYD